MILRPEIIRQNILSLNSCSGLARRLKSCLVVLINVAILLSVLINLASAQATPEVNCASGPVQQQYSSSGACSSPVGAFPLTLPDGGTIQQLLTPQRGQEVKKEVKRTTIGNTGQPGPAINKIIVYFFWGNGCPHCEEERQFLDELKRTQPSLEVRDFEVWYNKKNAGLMAAMLKAHGIRSSGVPATFVGDQIFSGFTKQTKSSLEKEIKRCRDTFCADPGEILREKIQPERVSNVKPFTAVTTARALETNKDASVVAIPYLGELDARTFSLPLLTLIIAGMDSFNPCAFFVLLTLLGLLVHAQSRRKMLLIGGVFVFFSGVIYFLFMAAWLNLFLVMGHVAAITMIAGIISLVIAGINIKDFFLFKQGVSLTIPASAKPKLFDRMRKLLRSTSLLSILTGAIVLAIVANSYELLCTAGFPMVFTRILTLNSLSPATYYLYLGLYNIVYVVPMAIIVIGFTYTLGRRQLTEWQGRVLKLMSGAMMLGLGAILIINPALLNSVLISLIILVVALSGSLLVAAVAKKLGY